MSKHRRSFTPSQKLEIVQHSLAEGMAKTKRRYEIADSVVRRWLDAYESEGEAGLARKGKTPQSDLELQNQRLLRELREYKAMVAERDLEIRIKDELLKKSQIRFGKK